MEVFKVFATMSLVDMISGPLGRVDGMMNAVGDSINKLSGRMGQLALSMTPLAIAGGIVLGSMGACVGVAAGFEDSMAKVGAVSRASAEDMALLEKTARHLGATTRFTASQVAQAEQYLAMAGLLGNVGIKGSMAGTGLKAMINKIAAPAGEAQKVLKDLGVTVQDSAGNLRSPIAVLGEMAGKIESMGTAQQIAALKTIVGEEAIAGFAELIQQEGVGAISKYVEQLQNAGGTAEEMAQRMGQTFGGSVRNMGSAWESLQITIGKVFLGAFIALKGALMAVSLPVWIVIGAFAALYLAYRTNFGGMADAINGWFSKISLAFRGVKAVISSLKGGVGEIRGELATEIKAAGLVGVVTTISKAIYRIIQLGQGIADGFRAGFANTSGIFYKAFGKLGNVFEPLNKAVSSILSKISGPEITSAASSWSKFGRLLGGAVGFALEAAATSILLVVNAFSYLHDMAWLVIAIFTGDFAGAASIFRNILATIGDSILAVADLFGFGDWLRKSWQSALDFLSGLNLFEYGSQIMTSLIDGVMGKAAALVDSVKGVFGKIRNLLPFSNAKEGPLSNLTQSGGAIMTTLGEGVTGRSGELKNDVAAALRQASPEVDTFWDELVALQAPVGSATPAPLPGANDFVGPVQPPKPEPDFWNELVAMQAPFTSKANDFAGPVSPPERAAMLRDYQPETGGGILNMLKGAFDSVTQGISSVWGGLFSQKGAHVPGAAIPSAPEFAGDADPGTGDRRGGKEINGRSFVVHIGQLVLPNADDAKSFLRELEDFVSEFGGDVSEA